MRRTVAIVIGLVIVGCSSDPPSPPPSREPRPLTGPGLNNVYQLNDRLISGSHPEGAIGFKSLHDLGVKTIISVDGSTPDQENATKFGMRYVHFPVGYDGVPQETAWRLARAVRDLPGPIYLHCHRGLHRGPAAAAAVRLCLEPDFTPDEARDWMQRAGTDPRYRGLIELPQRLKRPTTAELDALPADFPSLVPVNRLIQTMVSIDHEWDRIKSQGPKGTIPRESVVLLREAYREGLRTPEVTKRGADFVAKMTEAERLAGELEEAIQIKDAGRIEKAFQQSQKACSSCHARYRDGS